MILGGLLFLAHFVSPTGNDANPGTLSAPWATVAKVNAYVGGGTVYFQGGNDYYGQLVPVSYTNYASYGAGDARISGGVAITNWTQVDVPNNIWRATWNGGRPRALYMNNVRVVRARASYGLPAGTALTGTGYSTTSSTTPGIMSAWGNQSDIEIVYNAEWQNEYCPVSSIVGNVITMLATPFASCQAANVYTSVTGFINSPTKIENAYEIFTANNTPGTYYQDRTAGFVYLIPPTGAGNPNSATIVAPVLDSVLSVSAASHVSLSHLEFSNTTNLDAITYGHAEIQACMVTRSANQLFSSWVKTKAACTVTASDSIYFSRCTFSHLGTCGLDFDGVSPDCAANGNVFYDISGNGLQIGAPRQYTGTLPARVDVSNNYFATCGQEFQGSCAIFQFYALNAVISYNEIRKLPYTGISIGIGWGFIPSPSGQSLNIVSYNRIHDILLVRNDGGGIYLNERQINTQVDHNYVFNVGAGRTWSGLYSENFNGIYLDDYNQGISVHDNVVVGAHTNPYYAHNNVNGNFFFNNTADAGTYFVSPGVATIAPNTYDALSVVGTVPAQNAGVALGAGIQSAYADVKTKGDALVP